MKEIKTKKEIIDINYEAADGTLFCNADECRIYENSARGVISGRLAKFTINKGSEYDLFGRGMEDSDAFVVKPKDDKDIDAIRQFVALYGNYDEMAWLDNCIGKVVVVTISYDEYAWAQSLDNTLNHLMGDD